MKTLKPYSFTEDDLSQDLIAARQNYSARAIEVRVGLINKQWEETNDL